MAGKVTAGLAESNGSLPLGLGLCMCVALGLVGDGGRPPTTTGFMTACCHLQVDCLESGLSYGPYT